jgi:hypothetical protein
MKVIEPTICYRGNGRFPVAVVAIDTLQRVLLEACRSRGSLLHPMDATRILGLATPLSRAPRGRCWNCRHEIPEDLCEPSYEHPADWQGSWGAETHCPYWQARNGEDA